MLRLGRLEKLHQHEECNKTKMPSNSVYTRCLCPIKLQNSHHSVKKSCHVDGHKASLCSGGLKYIMGVIPFKKDYGQQLHHCVDLICCCFSISVAASLSTNYSLLLYSKPTFFFLGSRSTIGVFPFQGLCLLAQGLPQANKPSPIFVFKSDLLTVHFH